MTAEIKEEIYKHVRSYGTGYLRLWSLYTSSMLIHGLSYSTVELQIIKLLVWQTDALWGIHNRNHNEVFV